MTVKMDSVRFIDSLNFFQMPLSSFPATFNLEQKMKGFFPHLFNVPENMSYVGPVPPQHYYMPESMTLKTKEAFDKFYENAQAPVTRFDFKNELLLYCQSDVELLKLGCQKFQDIFEQYANFNPFNKITIASACNKDLRKNCMKKNTIACEPLYGWNGRQGNQSLIALEWLCWLNYEKRLQVIENMSVEEHEMHDDMAKYDVNYDDPRQRDQIQHERNGGEHAYPRLRGSVDGYEENTNIVYQFHGCYWHGCPTCFKNRTQEHRRLGGRRMCDAYEATKKKTQELKSLGYIVIEMWECQWDAYKKNHPDCQKYVDTLHFVKPLDPRDAFFGGRTNAAKLYHKCGPTEKIRYIDFTSLYPYINKTKEYPLNHPVIFCQPETTDISHFFGIAKVRIEAPFGLYNPVLPMRAENKLLFPLCQACVNEQLQKPVTERVPYCEHYHDQREFVGTWCTPELKKAVEMGYEIKEIYEVHHFHEHPPGLFKEYINKWLKIKQQASGWPKWCTTEAFKQKYIDDYYEKEGIKLEYDKIIPNDGLRNIAKLMLNSMWGKFGQALNKTKHAQIKSLEELYHYIDSDLYHVKKCDLQKNDNLTLYYDMTTTLGRHESQGQCLHCSIYHMLGSA